MHAIICLACATVINEEISGIHRHFISLFILLQDVRLSAFGKLPGTSFIAAQVSHGFNAAHFVLR